MKKYCFLFPFLFLFSFTYAQNDRESTTLTKIDQQVPRFQFTPVDDDEPILIEALQGKVVLINFFATWCGPCMAEIPHLKSDIFEKYNAEDLVIVMVGREHDKATVQKFKKDKKLEWMLVPDPKREIYKLFATKYIPRNVLLDKKGKIVYQSVGFEAKEFEVLKERIAKAVKN